MAIRQLAVQVLLGAAVLLVANICVRFLARNSVPRQLLLRGERAEPATDLFLGNSTMAAGLDETAFASVKPGRPLNIALGASSPVEHYAIYRQQDKHRTAAVYYGFLDTQLTDLPKGGWDTLVGNRAMAYYVDPDAAIRFYAADSPGRAFSLRLVGKVPILVERTSLWAKVEMVRRFLGEIGMPKKETNRFGRAEDFSLLEADSDEFVHRCRRAAADRIPLSAPLTAIFAQAKEWGTAVHVVEMPMPEGHRRRFYNSPEWKAYRAHLIELVQAAGGVYVPASDWVGEAGFADNLHLNAAGANEFSVRLGRWVQPVR